MTSQITEPTQWVAGECPICVVMITLNEEHNLGAALENLKGWAQEVVIVDSYSRDKTVDVALSYGARVVQRTFKNFGDQWNFALNGTSISAPYVMKLDPDERISDQLKTALIAATQRGAWDGMTVTRRWWFMERPLSIKEKILRVWKNGKCQFSGSVNEHPVVEGVTEHVEGMLEHLDSPDLDHWFEKQNRYSTLEAINSLHSTQMAATPKLFGTSLERRMWLKRILRKLPGNHWIMFFYYWIWKGTWKAGKVGYIAARLWSDVWRTRQYKRYEMVLTNKVPQKRTYGRGEPDHRVPNFD